MTRLHRALGLGWLMLPGAALAHSPIKGLDNFYAGLLHPLFVPSHFLAALALGILFGQQGPMRAQPALMAYLVAVLIGLAATLLAPGISLELPLLGVAALLGALIALDRPLPTLAQIALACLAGLLLGSDSAQEDLSGRGRLAALLGTTIAAYMLTLYAVMLAEFLTRRPWQRIGLRILGSWTAASALLVLSLALAR